MTALGDFIESRLAEEVDAEQLAADILAFQRAEGDTEGLAPTLTEVVEELARRQIKTIMKTETTTLGRSGSVPARRTVERKVRRTPEELDEEIVSALRLHRRMTVRLEAVQAYRAAEVSNPTWWRRALGLR